MIYKFTPYLKPVIWGGEKIIARKGLPGGPACVGESWELSDVDGHVSIVAEGPEKGDSLVDLISRHGEKLLGRSVMERYGDKFPLLVKIIDANQNLSVQVHPDDKLAMARHNCFGKTEMWYVLETEPDAHIYAGLSKQITPDDYTRLVENDTIMDVVADMHSAPGDVFFLPAGRIHAIGAGNLLAEIQQTSDITYRVYDYGRRDADGNTRQLHTDLAREAIDYAVYPEYKSNYDREAANAVVAECPYFKVSRIKAEGETMLPLPEDSFAIIVCVEGECKLTAPDGSEVSVKAFETALVPAEYASICITGTATLLLATA